MRRKILPGLVAPNYIPDIPYDEWMVPWPNVHNADGTEQLEDDGSWADEDEPQEEPQDQGQDVPGGGGAGSGSGVVPGNAIPAGPILVTPVGGVVVPIGGLSGNTSTPPPSLGGPSGPAPSPTPIRVSSPGGRSGATSKLPTTQQVTSPGGRPGATQKQVTSPGGRGGSVKQSTPKGPVKGTRPADGWESCAGSNGVDGWES